MEIFHDFPTQKHKSLGTPTDEDIAVEAEPKEAGGRGCFFGVRGADTQWLSTVIISDIYIYMSYVCMYVYIYIYIYVAIKDLHIYIYIYV